MRTTGGVTVLQDLAGIEKVNDFGQMQELRMWPGCKAQEVLAAIISRTEVLSFDIVKPSLHDIFLRIAGPQAREVNHE